MLKVTIQKWKVRKKTRWAVYRFEAGKFKRTFFKSKTEAEAEKQRLEGEVKAAGESWFSLPASDRERLMRAYDRALKLGLDIEKLIDRAEAEPNLVPMTMGKAYEKFISEKKTMRVSPKTLVALESNVGRFIKGREAASVRSISRDDVLTWLKRDGLSPRTFNTYRTSLNTFFRWCIETEVLGKSPMATIKAIDERQMPDIDEPPTILNVEQSKRLLKAALEIDKGLVTYIALGLFGGLRPEREAAQLAAGDIQGDLIFVRGMHAKDRQRRHVEMHPTLKAWLALPTAAEVCAGGEFQPTNLRRRFERVREAAGLIKIITEREPSKAGRPWHRKKLPNGKWKEIVDTGWGQDCLRHSFASHYLPVFGAEKTIAALGHGDYDMLFGHYRQLVKPDEAAEFWKLTPQVIHQQKGPANPR